jgi:hypothetical protein
LEQGHGDLSDGVITLQQVRTNMNDLRMKPLNGDGIIVAESTNSKNPL